MSITAAIAGRQLIRFIYDSNVRVVEPHTYGIDTKGHLALRAYQVSGGSSSGESRGWKLFHVREMHGITVLSETFSSARQGYKRGDTAFATIHAQL